MRTRILIAGALVALVAVQTRASLAPNANEAEVRAALEHYLLGHATGDGAHFRVVFHPDSKLYFNRDGKFSMRTSDDYIAGAPGKPAADEAQRKRRIVNVDVTGDAAVAKVELDYPNALLTDYFTLLKVDGKWMIMNKIFNTQPKR
ncbi:MAG: nuclear transport factor 2 family protein [Gemmatimonadaceae bacterium]